MLAVNLLHLLPNSACHRLRTRQLFARSGWRVQGQPCSPIRPSHLLLSEYQLCAPAPLRDPDAKHLDRLVSRLLGGRQSALSGALPRNLAQANRKLLLPAASSKVRVN